MQPVDLNVVLHHILDDLQIAMAEKEAQVQVEPLPVVDGIEVQLGQVFQNLISNSLKFSAPGRKPVIHIRCEKENGFYKIDYSDNGIGFDNSMATKIFDIFQRLHPKDNYEGTGIGLAIVKKIIDQHNGTIKAISETNNGTRFEIRLPAVRHTN